MPGGNLRCSDMTIASAGALRFAAQLHPDFLVVSVASLSARSGCLDFDHFEIEFKQSVAPQAGAVIVVADSSKFEAPGLMTTFAWSEVHTPGHRTVPLRAIWRPLSAPCGWCYPLRLERRLSVGLRDLVDPHPHLDRLERAVVSR